MVLLLLCKISTLMTYLSYIYIICHFFAKICCKHSEACVRKKEEFVFCLPKYAVGIVRHMFRNKDYVFMSFFTTFKIFSLFGIAQVNLALLSHIEKILSLKIKIMSSYLLFII